jgi:RHH-type proline utilization regulon transcriptional repressor/proline dehydrogenase/delta 1-pyrroline-5-carboxylate dehydrogenase
MRPQAQADWAALLAAASSQPRDAQAIHDRAAQLVRAQRAALSQRWIDCVLQQYSIGTPEGLALLTLAEAYLRIPDRGTALELLAEKLAAGDWSAHRGASSHWQVNAATRALMLARAWLGAEPVRRARLLRPLVSVTLYALAGHFIFGRDIDHALARSRRGDLRQYRYSFDMLGESACTQADADRYRSAYERAIARVGARPHAGAGIGERDGISVKLSALYPRYEPLQRAHAVPQLAQILSELACAAAACNIGLTIDAEQSERLEMSLDILARVAGDRRLRGWEGLGIAVQAYHVRAAAVIERIAELARTSAQRLSVRLVKGAYWDIEIKRAQELGLAEFPVYTLKAATDVSYLACARRLLAEPRLYAAFATHNAHSVASILQWCGARRDFEFQRLHGMGAGLYEPLIADEAVRCRVYAPVGHYAQLLPYLVRRILENGANAGFVHRLAQSSMLDESLLSDPVTAVQAARWPHDEAIVKPLNLFAERRNSAGIDFSDVVETERLREALAASWAQSWQAAPIIGGRECAGAAVPVRDPAALERTIGTVVQGTAGQVREAFDRAQAAQPDWAARSPGERASCLERAADLLEREREALMGLAIREAGKTVTDALAEVREAVDYCRYYAAQARGTLAPLALPGPTGELNALHWAARGIFACISPWNFPLAIFLGQISAALVTGNAVIAKPAPQTPLIAAAAVRLLLQAGIPPEVMALLPGGDELGAAITAEPRLAGVAFTGSLQSARRIARSLLTDEGRPLVPLIAETGGLNAMIVDSSALLERAIGDAMVSAFQSAGQRCSALRLLCLQEDIAEPALQLLTGAMALLRVGDPMQFDTDVGPVIDALAQEALESYVSGLSAAQLLYRCTLPGECAGGHYVAPTLVRLQRIEDLREEVFGPVLHVVTWRAGELEETLARINASGYGLTMGLQTRLGQHTELLRREAHAGNLYVNRSMIGAVVGAQPFGGEGLSGTGPKAGGPHYLARFMTERTVSIDTTAAGGNIALLRQSN